MLNLVSVVIPTYNYGHFVNEAIESVFSQTYKDLEMLVIDDGSTDETQDLLERYLYNPKFVFVTQKNMGAIVARNTGLLLSKGSYVLFLDADDILKPTAIEKLVFELENQNECDLVVCNYTELRSNGHVKERSIVSKISEKWFWSNPARTPFPPSVTLIRKTLFSKTGIWDTTLQSPAEDYDLFRRFSINGKLCFVDESLVIKRSHENNLSNQSSERYFQDNLRAVRRMFSEDRQVNTLRNRLRTWNLLHFGFLKHAVKYKDLQLFVRVLVNSSRYFRG